MFRSHLKTDILGRSLNALCHLVSFLFSLNEARCMASRSYFFCLLSCTIFHYLLFDIACFFRRGEVSLLHILLADHAECVALGVVGKVDNMTRLHELLYV